MKHTKDGRRVVWLTGRLTARRLAALFKAGERVRLEWPKDRYGYGWQGRTLTVDMVEPAVTIGSGDGPRVYFSAKGRRAGKTYILFASGGLSGGLSWRSNECRARGGSLTKYVARVTYLEGD